MKKIFSWPLLLIGAFFTFFPHSVHVAVGASYVDHPVHVGFGIACLLLGAWMMNSSRA